MPRWTPERIDELRAAVAASHSLTDTLRTLGLRTAGGNFRTIRELITVHDISTEHFDPYASRRGRGRLPRAPIEKLLVANSTTSRSYLKQRLLDDGLLARECVMCGQGEDWRGRRMSLILDHINGAADDNRLENLRLLCPNCNATLDTHCGKNKRQARTSVCVSCGKTFRAWGSDQRFCSRTCGRFHSAVAARRVERPAFRTLVAEVSQQGFCAVGRKYGVSDNAIRKWIRAYELERGARAGDGVRFAPSRRPE